MKSALRVNHIQADHLIYDHDKNILKVKHAFPRFIVDRILENLLYLKIHNMSPLNSQNTIIVHFLV
jgi:hypothetical protein